MLTYFNGCGQTLWSFEDCLSHAIENDSELSTNKIQKRKSVLSNKLQQQQRRIPDLNIINNIGLQIGKSVDPTTNSFGTGAAITQAVGLASSINLLDGGINKSVRELNGLEIERTNALFEYRQQELAMLIFNDYTNVLLSKQQSNLFQHNIDKAKFRLKIIEAKIEQGAVAKTELYLVKAQLLQYEQQFESAVNTYKANLISLKKLINYPDNTEFDVVEINLEETEVIDTNMEEWISASIQEDPSLELFEKDKSIIEENIMIERKQHMPRLNLSLDLYSNFSSQAATITEFRNEEYSRIAKIDGKSSMLQTNELIPVYDNINVANQWKDNFGQSVRLQLSYPIGKIFTRKNRVQLIQLELQEVMLKQTQVKSDYNAKWQSFQNKIEGLESRLVKIVEEISLMNELLAVKEVSLDLGHSNSYEIYELQQDLDKLESNKLNIRYQLFFEKQLMRFMEKGAFEQFEYIQD